MERIRMTKYDVWWIDFRWAWKNIAVFNMLSLVAVDIDTDNEGQIVIYTGIHV